jgi:peptidoglycan/LPS O-acetylase OafA/YrhL
MNNSTQKHIEILDGIRGLAIILVLFAHFVREDFNLKNFSFVGSIFTKISLMGLTGVSLFFVLSGFLITGILLAVKNKKHYFQNFYGRRILRIFPLYYLSLFLVFIILQIIIDFTRESLFLQGKQFWLWSYLSNIPSVAGIWNRSDQFALGHFWSLSVEEHFYILWPLIILYTDINKMVTICKTIIIISLAAGISSTLLMNDHIFFKLLSWTTITFSGSLALGALLAIHKYQHGSLSLLSKTGKSWMVIFGILFLFVGFFPRKYNADLRGIIAHEISWFFYAGLIIYLLNLKPTSIIYKSFTNSLLLLFGKISYGIYIYHGILMPVFQKMEIDTLSDKLGSPLIALLLYYIIAIGTCFLIAMLSWNFLEKRFLKLKNFFIY